MKYISTNSPATVVNLGTVPPSSQGSHFTDYWYPCGAFQLAKSCSSAGWDANETCGSTWRNRPEDDLRRYSTFSITIGWNEESSFIFLLDLLVHIITTRRGLKHFWILFDKTAIRPCYWNTAKTICYSTSFNFLVKIAYNVTCGPWQCNILFVGFLSQSQFKFWSSKRLFAWKEKAFSHNLKQKVSPISNR